MPYAQVSADIPFVFGEVQTSKRGQKFAPITVNGSSQLYQLTDFDHALYAPFGCGVYQEKGDETEKFNEMMQSNEKVMVEVR